MPRHPQRDGNLRRDAEGRPRPRSAVEQDLDRGLAIADRVVCLLEGRVALEGAAAALSRDQVTQAYFGLADPPGSSP